MALDHGARWRARLFVALAVLAAIVHSAVWLALSDRVKLGFAVFVAQQRELGWSITTGEPRRAGWPFAAGLDVPAVVAGAETQGGVVWTVPAIALRVGLLHPTVLTATVSGAQTVRLGASPPVPVEARSMHVDVPLDGLPATLSAAGLTIGLPGARLAAESAEVACAEAGCMLTAQGLAVPDTPALGTAEVLTVDATLTRPIPLAATPKAQADAWRAAGGTVKVASVRFVWHGLTVAGRGTLRLDPALQPEFDGVAMVSGYRPALDELARAGVLSPRAAAAAATVLDLLAAPLGGGPVPLPLKLQDGVLVIARFPLLRVPGIDWGPG